MIPEAVVQSPAAALRAFRAGRPLIFFALAVPLAAAFALIPPARLLSGIYAWHVHQPSASEGAAELLGLIALWFASLWLMRSRSSTLTAIGVLCAVYLQLHRALVATVAALVLFELFVQLGGAARSLLRRSRAQPAEATLQLQLESWLIGVTVWTACAIAASAVRLGGLPHLRILALGLGALCLALSRREPFLVTAAKRFLRASRVDASLSLFLLGLLILQLAKAAVVLDYDSNWYGARPEKVLFGVRSFFTNLHLVDFVYYYPSKLFELIAAPVSGLGEHSFILTANVAVLAVGMVAFYQFAREAGVGVSESLLLACVAASIPGISNMASTAKGDLLGAVLGIIAAQSFWRAARDRSLWLLLPGSVALVQMLLARMTSYLYAPLLLASVVPVWLLLRGDGSPKGPDARPAERRLWVAVLALSLLELLALALRSVRFTGLPTPPILTPLWNALGLHAHYPADQLAREYTLAQPFSRPLKELLHFWGQFFFDPTGLDHVIIAWPGNCALLLLVHCALAATLLLRRPRRDELALLALALPSCAGALLYATFGVFPHVAPGGDGNYYILGAALGTLSFGAMLLRLLSEQAKVAVAILAACTLGQVPIAFISHWSWVPGTAPFSLQLGHFLPGARDRWKAQAAQLSLEPLLDYSAAHPELTTCAGWTWVPPVARAALPVPQMILWGMSCRYEDLDQLIAAYPALFASEAKVMRLLRWKEVDLLVMPQTPMLPGEPPALRRSFERLRANPLVSAHESGPYVFLDLSRLTGVNR